MTEKSVKTRATREYVTLGAIDKYLTSTVPSAEESTRPGQDLVTWGEDNLFPEYLNGLYQDVGLLKSIIVGCSDIALGNEVRGLDYSLAKKLALSWFTYGGFAIQVICDRLGNVASLSYVDLRKLRTNSDCSEFYYSDNWGKYTTKYLKYPKYSKGSSGIVYVKSSFEGTYPSPLYGAKTTLQCCELQKEITNYHVASIQNGFSGGVVFQFSNGIPTDEQKAEIEKNILEKFSGSGNAGRILINFSDDLDHGLTLDQLDTVDYGEKYSNLQDHTREEIFTAFRATPNLFGIPTETTGFNDQEYQGAFKLFNRFTIRPFQVALKSTLASLGYSLEITPYSLD